MRKSASVTVPRSTSSHFAATVARQKNSPSKPFPHSTSQQDCRTTNISSNKTTRSQSICPRSHSSIFFRPLTGTTSATTRELSRFEPILNNDTDSLKIGDRVFVNGQWAGTILYIGETTLGSGEWAGVILEDASRGKTNGLVRGRCYFQTTNNRGIFCRLTKLTRQIVDLEKKC